MLIRLNGASPTKCLSYTPLAWILSGCLLISACAYDASHDSVPTKPSGEASAGPISQASGNKPAQTFQIKKLSNPTEQLEQLSNWLKNGQTKQLSGWINTHRDEALAVAREIFVDVYASPWLGLPPLKSNSQALLPVFERELKLPLDEESCNWSGVGFPGWEERLPETCQHLPWLGEFSSLAFAQEALDDRLIDKMTALGNPSVSLALNFDKNQTEIGERTKLQQLYLEGLRNDQPDKLIQALDLAHKWQAAEIEGLILIAQAEVRLRQDTAPISQLGKAKPDQKIMGKILAAMESAKDVFMHIGISGSKFYSPRLEASAKLALARNLGDNTSLVRAAALIRELKQPTRDVLELELADQYYHQAQAVKGRQIYFRLLNQASTRIQDQIISRILHRADPLELPWLSSRWEKENRPEGRIRLIETYVLQEDYTHLAQLLKVEHHQEVRRKMVEALGNRLASGSVVPPSVIKFVESLKKDPDPVIRDFIQGAVERAKQAKQ